jgi:hypothetical protein
MDEFKVPLDMETMLRLEEVFTLGSIRQNPNRGAGGQSPL